MQIEIVLKAAPPKDGHRETYSFISDFGGKYLWDVTTAWHLILAHGSDGVKSRLCLVGLESFAELLPRMEIDKAKAASDEVDVDIPILIVADPTPDLPQPMHVLIDGWHRVYKATQQGRNELLAIFLTPEEEAAIRCVELRPGYWQAQDGCIVECVF